MACFRRNMTIEWLIEKKQVVVFKKKNVFIVERLDFSAVYILIQYFYGAPKVRQG